MQMKKFENIRNKFYSSVYSTPLFWPRPPHAANPRHNNSPREKPVRIDCLCFVIELLQMNWVQDLIQAEKGGLFLSSLRTILVNILWGFAQTDELW